jgi:hypothetical protein
MVESSNPDFRPSEDLFSFDTYKQFLLKKWMDASQNMVFYRSYDLSNRYTDSLDYFDKFISDLLDVYIQLKPKVENSNSKKKEAFNNFINYFYDHNLFYSGGVPISRKAIELYLLLRDLLEELKITTGDDK